MTLREGDRVRVRPGTGDAGMVKGKSRDGTVVGVAIDTQGEYLTIMLDGGEMI